jgi:hypothetical protein
MTTLKDMIPGNPIHSRDLGFRTYALEGEKVIVEGRLTDERFHPIYDLAGEVREKGLIHDMVIYLLVGDMPLRILDAEVEMRHVPREDCRTTRESVRRIVGVEIKSGFSDRVHKLMGGVEGCAHLTHLLVVMVQAALHGYWTHQMRQPRPVPRTLEEMEGLAYLVNSCALWEKEGPIVREIRGILEKKNRPEGE